MRVRGRVTIAESIERRKLLVALICCCYGCWCCSIRMAEHPNMIVHLPMFIFGWLHFSTANNECQAERQHEGAFEHWIFLCCECLQHRHTQCPAISVPSSIIRLSSTSRYFSSTTKCKQLETNNEFRFDSMRMLSRAHCDQSISFTRSYVYPNIQRLSIESQTFQMITQHKQSKKKAYTQESKQASKKKNECDTPNGTYTKAN